VIRLYVLNVHWRFIVFLAAYDFNHDAGSGTDDAELAVNAACSLTEDAWAFGGHGITSVVGAGGAGAVAFFEVGFFLGLEVEAQHAVASSEFAPPKHVFGPKFGLLDLALPDRGEDAAGAVVR
jgi:hypothetical protein